MSLLAQFNSSAPPILSAAPSYAWRQAANGSNSAGHLKQAGGPGFAQLASSDPSLQSSSPSHCHDELIQYPLWHRNPLQGGTVGSVNAS